jgi:hypothetical protein
VTTPITGGCACGAIRYECTAEPRFALHCQCRDCQRFGGTGHLSIMIVPKTAVTLTGAPTFYETVGDSGHAVDRGFCPRCGSPVIGRYAGFPDAVGLAAGCLDDPARFQPSVVIYAGSAQTWDVMDPALPAFPQMPPARR